MASNAAGFAALDAQIKKLKSLRLLPEEAAKEVAIALGDELRANITAGRGPDGEAWQPTKDGQVPLRNAAANLTVRAVGTTVTATVLGPEALHSIGAARGGIKRAILPTKRIPDAAIKAIQKVWDKWARS